MDKKEGLTVSYHWTKDSVTTSFSHLVEEEFSSVQLRHLKKFLTATNPVLSEASYDYGLTKAELNVLPWLAKGYRISELASDHLYVAKDTLNKHVMNIKRKLNVGTLAGVVFFAAVKGLIHPDVHLEMNPYKPATKKATSTDATSEEIVANYLPENLF